MGAKCACEKSDVAPDQQQSDEVRQVTEAPAAPEAVKPSDELSDFIKRDANLSARDASERTALHLAAAAGAASSIAALLDAKADIDAVDAQGLTPLNAAVEAGQLESCTALLEKGAALEIAST